MGVCTSDSSKPDEDEQNTTTTTQTNNENETTGGTTNNNDTTTDNNKSTNEEKSDISDLPKKISAYAFKRTLGKGASCRVVEGVDKNDDSKHVAIKIMSKDRKVIKKLYEKEVELLTKLTKNGKELHKNVIRYVCHEEDEDSYYLVTEYCGGGELFDRIVSKDEKYMFTEKKASLIVKQGFEALKFCHDHNIVHRDLKPENFVYETNDPDSEVVLIDFGCGMIIDPNDKHKSYNSLVGTAYYLAPELAYVALSKSKNMEVSSRYGSKVQDRTGDILKATDVWSMGVIAYVMMTGRAPFRGRNNQEIFESIVNNPVTYPEKDVRYKTPLELSDSFKDFISKVLVKDPLKRITLDGALKHPWVVGLENSTYKHNVDVIRYLRQFNYQSKLKKAITKVLAENMTKEPENQVKRHFLRLDADGDGYLDDTELCLLLRDMGYTKSLALNEAREIIKQNDLNKDGLIDFEEFKAIWYRKILSSNDQYIHRVFDVFDANGDGQIDLQELKQVLNSEGDDDEENNEQSDDGNYYGLDALIKMIEEVDKNGDHQISFDEFEKAMTEDIKSDRLNMDGFSAGLRVQSKEDQFN